MVALGKACVADVKSVQAASICQKKKLLRTPVPLGTARPTEDSNVGVDPKKWRALHANTALGTVSPAKYPNIGVDTRIQYVPPEIFGNMN